MRLAYSDPARAAALAQRALRRASALDDPEACAVAERALGLAARARDDLRGSELHLRRAIGVAEQAGLHARAAEGRVSLVGTLALRGDSKGALREAALAGGVLRGVARAQLESQTARLHLHLGQLDDALEGYRRALPLLRRAQDRLGEAHAYVGRGMAQYLRGATIPAEADMRRAERLYTELGETRLAAHTLQHLALVLALRGDIPEALRCFDQADDYLGGAQAAGGMGLIDRSEVELAARLVPEARLAAQTAVDALTDQGQTAYLAVAWLRLAQAALVEGDSVTARRYAQDAQSAFTTQRRPAWAAAARHVAVRATLLEGECSSALLEAARRAARELSAAGFASPAQDARLLAATLALGLGRRKVARRELALASEARHRGPVELRVRAWHAEGLLRLAEGNRRGAASALLAGVRLLERYRAALGATELRAHASGHATQLTRLGLSLAIADGDADRSLEWAERWRAGSLRLAPVRPPDDTRLANALSELRAVVNEAETAALSGRPTAGLHARQAALEEVVRARARHASGVMTAFLEPSPNARELKRAVGEDALVEMIDHDGVLYAVVVVAGRARLRRLAPAALVGEELDGLRFALRRLAVGHGSPRSLAAAADAVAYGAKHLDALLFAPLAVDVADRPLVVVPTGRLHAMPWSVLPTCAGRAVTVAPSAALWRRVGRSSQPVGRDRIVLVAGPGLPHAATEVAALARRYAGATRMGGSGATCRAVCSAIDGAALAHVAAHGRFRADNPLFSSLQLADGPLTVYDLEALEKAPSTLVLSACDSGLSDVQPGDELMGLAAAVFALGTRTLVASVFPVPDGATRALMLSFHTGLRAGHNPAAALARAQRRIGATGAAGLAAASAFVCFGAGSAPGLPERA
jgi:tetratricopeptide (TPR) repeat protein